MPQSTRICKAPAPIFTRLTVRLRVRASRGIIEFPPIGIHGQIEVSVGANPAQYSMSIEDEDHQPAALVVY